MIVLVAVVAGAIVETVNVALELPPETVTDVGTVATVVLLLVSVTTTPPDGAALPRATVPVDGVPPVTLVGFRLTADNEGSGALALVRVIVPRFGTAW